VFIVQIDGFKKSIKIIKAILDCQVDKEDDETEEI